MSKQARFSRLKAEIERIEQELDLQDYLAFSFWFIETMFGWDRKSVLDVLCDGTHDKGVDAVVVNQTDNHVVVLQSKFEREGGSASIRDGDVRNFAAVREYFRSPRALLAATPKANARARRLLDSAMTQVRNRGADVELIFASTHKSPPTLESFIVETLGLRPHQLKVYDFDSVLRLAEERQRNWTPPLGTYFLPYEAGDGEIVRTEPYNSWVVSVPIERVSTMVSDLTQEKLFRKNVRNSLGRNVVNNRISETLEKEPDHFWYYNNGISVLCDDATLSKERKGILITNPQIVNGCQTAMSIRSYRGDLNGSVLVRVIKATDYDFTTAITLYQNSSNPVKNRDFKSNDPVQVRLKTELKRRGWFLTIKRGETLGDELKRTSAARLEYPHGEINNEHIAKCLVAVSDPGLAVSKGSDLFFGDMYNEIFTTKLSTFDALCPYFAWLTARYSYYGERRFHGLKAATFKGRASFYVLGLWMRAMKELEDAKWRKDFVYFWEGLGGDDQSWLGFRDAAYPLIDEIFELIYRAWKVKSKVEDVEYDTFLQAGGTFSEILTSNRKGVSKFGQGMVKAYQKHVQPWAQAVDRPVR